MLAVSNATTLLSAPSNLVFGYTSGNALPAAQNLTVSSSVGATPSFGVAPVNASGLLLGQSGNTITVGINPAGLTPNNAYIGGVQIIPSGGTSPLIIPVVFYYGLAAQVSVSPTSLNFNYQIGATNNVVQKSLALPITLYVTSVTRSCSTCRQVFRLAPFWALAQVPLRSSI